MPRMGLVLLFCLSLTLCACQSTESQVSDLVRRHLNAMVFVKGGTFMMGNPGGWDTGWDSWPPHQVTLDSFYIQKYEVTNRDFDLFMKITGYKPSYFLYNQIRQENPQHYAPKLPAIASWIDARAFCHWLGERSGKSVDLPTEAQWEYAARSRGQMLRYATNTGDAMPYINILPKAPRGYVDTEALPLPPGSFPPNPLGLYDMSGNVAEWVLDNYSSDYYEKSPERNPQGPEVGTRTLDGKWADKVLRGGNIYDLLGNTTVSRMAHPEDANYPGFGFRCAMSASAAHSENAENSKFAPGSHKKPN